MGERMESVDECDEGADEFGVNGRVNMLNSPVERKAARRTSDVREDWSMASAVMRMGWSCKVDLHISVRVSPDVW